MLLNYGTLKENANILLNQRTTLIGSVALDTHQDPRLVQLEKQPLHHTSHQSDGMDI